MSISLADVQRAGFPMGGEPLIALDLVDTKMLVTDPPQDLIPDEATASAWWRVQSPRLPAGPPPDLADTRRLRTAIRDLFDAHLAGRTPAADSLAAVNTAAAAVPTSLGLIAAGDGYREETRWHTEHGGNAALAATARGAIELLADETRLTRLRRCASPTCSMLFLAETTRRQWCTPNICGNRARVARHYRRAHQPPFTN
ncbi:CGNR zinc finger domain-containing protein [Asanoa sp. WMMD1127]|uniref:CGNR zinc finger domain-containing protein n=1 Tax=Asanoa sp. WMMD1127 TaxID=3016107 RepID=UPI002416C009|nr:CGNR zinc finger domain-containing protein [Asanoa sp. WMMD1127]MDG4824489.1 CGNR zinc finger domain-containing protein [Asanoa sp. WMMD1127]